MTAKRSNFSPSAYSYESIHESDIPFMNERRMDHEAVVTSSGKICAMGGYREKQRPDPRGIPLGTGKYEVTNTVEVYDPAKDSWSYRRPMPAPIESHDAVLGADNKIYIMGGIGERKGPPLRDVFVYDPIQDTWKIGPKMKIPRADPAAVSTPEGRIYVIGGTDIGAYKKREQYNFYLPKKLEFYTGKVQDTVEVLDVSKLNQD